MTGVKTEKDVTAKVRTKKNPYVKQNITVRIDPRLLAKINRIAEDEGRTRTNVIHLALLRLVKAYDVDGHLANL